MTLLDGLRQQRNYPISQGGFGNWIGDPSVVPPPSAFNMGTAGVVVNERTVLSLMVVSTCIRILGDAGSGLEPHCYRMTGNRVNTAKDKEIDPPDVIMDPYADMDREEGDFKRIASHGLNGNQVSHVVDRQGGKNGNPVQMEVLNPAALKIEIKDGRKTYQVGATGPTLNPKDVIHKPWISLAGGVVGVNPIEIGINGFGIPIAAEQYASRFYAQGIHPTGILSLDKPLRSDDKKRIEQELHTKHGGLAQAHTPLVLDAAARWQQITINPETAQLLQTRAFSRGEIMGFYGVPAFLGGDSPDNGGPWGKGLQEWVMAFAMFSLSGYIRRLDRGDSDLLPAGYYVRRHVKELFKTNDVAQAAFIQAVRTMSVATPNEARELIGLAPSDEVGADSIWGPVNSAHNDWLAMGDQGPEAGLADGLNVMGDGQAAPGEGSGSAGK